MVAGSPSRIILGALMDYDLLKLRQFFTSLNDNVKSILKIKELLESKEQKFETRSGIIDKIFIGKLKRFTNKDKDKNNK